jgi:leucyl/phenylalanyl-tRNA---protein transferase
MSLLIDFPDPRTSRDIDGVLCVSETAFLNPDNLIHAYRLGIFPWMIEGYEYVPWHCPRRRGVLNFDALHVPKSLRKSKEKAGLTFTIDRAFAEVIYACAVTRRKGQAGATWITQDVFDNYIELHERGHAHSVEAWKAGELVGGLYGVDAGGLFCGESMFHRVTDASKLSLLFLTDHLKSRGANWLDIQVMTPHMRILGAVEIGRNEFLDRLAAVQKLGLEIF